MFHLEPAPFNSEPLVSSRRTVLFLQLPQLDTDARGKHENVYLAAAYLRAALARSAEGRRWRTVIPPPAWDLLDDRHLLDAIRRVRPDAVAATLYLWNVERTLDLLRRLRDVLPCLRVAVGGPEVARRHPFLFRSKAADAAVTGEGETVFASVLRALRRGGTTDWRTVAWRRGRQYVWGKRPAPVADLAAVLPSPRDPANRPNADRVGYAETGRGCAWRCAFCCYNQRRDGMSFLDAAQVLERVRVLRKRGTCEVRFVDPTFNSNPHFEAILRGLARLNRDRRLRFFAELRADRLTPEQGRLLVAANVREVEVGVQSRDPRVLNAIRRPVDLAAQEEGIRILSRHGIAITLDIMCGLPGQTRGDIVRTMRWAPRIRGVDVQVLHTLLLPGTELRDRRRALGLRAQTRPPYRVTATPVLSASAIRAAEETVCRIGGFEWDARTERFAGRRLPDLYPEQVRVSVRDLPRAVPGRENRRAVIFLGGDLWAARKGICRMVREAIESEPHMLWQFVLCGDRAFPLDLLEAVTRDVLRFPPHVTDNLILESPCRAARRVLVLLRPGVRYPRSWVSACERFLRDRFY